MRTFDTTLRVPMAHPLVRTTWRFVYDAQLHRLTCIRWIVESRLTPRHKFRATRTWSHIDSRDPAPDIPQCVFDDVLNAFRESLTVGL